MELIRPSVITPSMEDKQEVHKRLTGFHTSSGQYMQELLDSNSINERSTSGIFLLPRVMECHLRRLRSRPESKRNHIAAIAAVECLQGNVSGQGGNRHPQNLFLRARSRRRKRQRVNRPLLHRDCLRYRRLVSQPHGVHAVRHRKEHPARLRPAGDVLH
nr:hypothetical protein VIGAN_03230100 [Ipomoea batatas]